MLPGFNHNLRHRDVVFHVQTEDGGLRDPRVVTQLFIGGRCLAVRRWSYADADPRARDLEARVRDQMRAMHKSMLRAVTRGEFDAQLPGPAPGPAGLPPDVTPTEAPPGPAGSGRARRAADPFPPGEATLEVPATEAPTLEAPIEALEEQTAPSPAAPRTAPGVPRSGRRRPVFEAPTLSDDELLAEIDAELRRREPSSPRRPPADPEAPAPRSAPRRRFPSAAHTLVEPPSLMKRRIEQREDPPSALASPRRSAPPRPASGRRPTSSSSSHRPHPAEAPDAPTLEDVILDYLSGE